MNSSESATGSERFEFDGFVLNPRQRRLYAPDGITVALNARAFEALLLLVRSASQVVGRPMFMRTLWQGLVVEPNNVDQCAMMRRARRRSVRVTPILAIDFGGKGGTRNRRKPESDE